MYSFINMYATLDLSIGLYLPYVTHHLSCWVFA